MNVWFCYPFKPYPRTSGTHHRAAEMLSALRELGHRVRFVGSDWQEPSWANFDQTLFPVDEVVVYKATLADRMIQRLLARMVAVLGRDPELGSLLYSPVGMKAWFARMFVQDCPDIIWMNYVYWDRLLTRHIRASARCVIDTHDILSVSRKMWTAAAQHFSRVDFDLTRIPEAAVSEKFYGSFDVTPEPEEFEIMDKYAVTIAINAVEALTIGKRTKVTRIIEIPATYAKQDAGNSYSRGAVFAMGPNPFNLQGYAYLAKNVLPNVLSRIPDFFVTVTGRETERLPKAAGVEYVGFLEDISRIYEDARFALCPSYGGTGQQLKIVEAMAHGLAVVALRDAARSSPVVHGVNGYVADTAVQFSELAARLWKSPGLCRRLGLAAKRTIHQLSSKEVLHPLVRQCLEG